MHYHNTLLIDVDAQIRLKESETTTVSGAHILAKELRQNLENNVNIHKAKIFLDLNAGSGLLPTNVFIAKNTTAATASP